MFKEIMDVTPKGKSCLDMSSLIIQALRRFYTRGSPKGELPPEFLPIWGVPESASPANPVPAVVLVHGGGGHAFAEWVRIWNERGYAAIAMGNTGHFPKRAGKINIYAPEDWTHEIDEMELKADGWTLIPDNDGMKSYEQELSSQWMYHAVGSVILAHNLLRADERIDSGKIGVTGISWGGVITSIVMNHDNRFAFYIPVYGCAHLGESLTWMKDCFTPGALKLWDASRRLNYSSAPVLWVCWASDGAFSINTNNASYEDTIQRAALSMRIDMLHGMCRAGFRWRYIGLPIGRLKAGSL